VSIDVDKNEVVIKNGGVLTNLTFKVAKGPLPGDAAAAKAGMGAIATPNPGKFAQGFQGVVPPANASQPAINYNQTGSGRNGVIMTGGNPAYQEPAAGVGAPATGYNPAAYNPAGGGIANPLQNNPGIRSIPPRSIRSGLPQQNDPAQQQQPLSPEAQVLQMEHNRKINPPNFPPLPQVPGLTPGQ
jgi:hypothetical protein